MKKSISIVLTILSLVMILDSINIGPAIAMFLLAGMIPGTSIVLSAQATLSFFALLIGFTLSRAYIGFSKSFSKSIDSKFLAEA